MKDRKQRLTDKLFLLAVVCACVAAFSSSPVFGAQKQWTIYLAQDKHLDYNWCGSTTEIELKMAALLDYYLDQAEQDRVCWNLDGTIWQEVFQRHRGEEGTQRLRKAIQDGQIGYAGNYAVLLWGILDTETAIRACYGALPVEQATGIPARTALIMENPGLTWGAASILSECNFDFLGRGIYQLRAESYIGQRQPYPLFWWQAPNGKRVLVHWDLYHDTKSWGGYAEAHLLASLAGEKWDALHLRAFGDRNTAEVYRQRKEFIRKTIGHYEAYGKDYPISSILLLGSGWDNWTKSTDLSEFIRRFNDESDGSVRLVDARYQDFFEAAEKEIRENDLAVPILTGSFGICWEEWAAHLAGPTSAFREAQRLLRLAEAADAVNLMTGREEGQQRDLLHYGFNQLLKYAEHDFGGIDRQRAAMSAGVRASAATQALDIGHSLAPRPGHNTVVSAAAGVSEDTTFAWRGGKVVFDPRYCAVVSLEDAGGHEWVPAGSYWGQFVHTCYQSRANSASVIPVAMADAEEPVVRSVVCRSSDQGIVVEAGFDQAGFHIDSDWFFHADSPHVDVTYRVRDGWTDAPQSVEFCFPLNVARPVYRYDTPGAIVVAGPQEAGGNDLPGANPELFAGVTFAAASNARRTALLVTPDQLLLRFGAAVEHPVPAQIRSMPMMNLTGNDWQFGQGGQREWTYRYRVVLLDQGFDPVQAVTEANRFATPPFLQVPGQAAVIPGINILDIQFPGGPLLALKTAEDNRRVILRFWNVTDQPVRGSVRLPPGWTSAELCDALERRHESVKVVEGRVPFEAGPFGIVTVALVKKK